MFTQQLPWLGAQAFPWALKRSGLLTVAESKWNTVMCGRRRQQWCVGLHICPDLRRFLAVTVQQHRLTQAHIPGAAFCQTHLSQWWIVEGWLHSMRERACASLSFHFHLCQLTACQLKMKNAWTLFPLLHECQWCAHHSSQDVPIQDVPICVCETSTCRCAVATLLFFERQRNAWP